MRVFRRICVEKQGELATSEWLARLEPPCSREDGTGVNDNTDHVLQSLASDTVTSHKARGWHTCGVIEVPLGV